MFDFLFATFLYAAMICFVCCLRYQPSCAATISTDTANLAADINQVWTTEPEMKPESAMPKAVRKVTNALIETETNSQLPVSHYIKEASEAGDSQPISLVTGRNSLSSVLDPSKLTLRQCRAVIREINKGLPKQDRIRQKINGKDAPADWLRGQIARYLETHPDETMAMEEIR
jgi:hypothetical protein